MVDGIKVQSETNVLASQVVAVPVIAVSDEIRNVVQDQLFLSTLEYFTERK